MQKTKRYQKAFSKGLQIWITPHWQRLHGFGLAVKEQTHQTHGMPKYFFFLFRMFASSLAKGRWTEWGLLSCLQFSTQTRLWMTVLALKWLLFPQARRREKMEALHTSACPNPPLPCNHWDGELVLSTGAHRDICTGDKMSGESWAPTISHNRMRNLHTIGCYSSFSQPKETQPWMSFPELVAKDFLLSLRPHQDALQGMTDSNPVSVYCLQICLRTNNVLPLAAMQNVVQGVLSALSSLFKVR